VGDGGNILFEFECFCDEVEGKKRASSIIGEIPRAEILALVSENRAYHVTINDHFELINLGSTRAEIYTHQKDQLGVQYPQEYMLYIQVLPIN
jgi:hypothetical protein